MTWYQKAVGAMSILAATATTMTLSGCSGTPGCQSGAKSPTEAVNELLEAATEMDASRACIVTTEMSDESLESNLGEIAAFVSGVGGMNSIVVREVTEEQLGSAHKVEVGVMDSTARVSFTVLQSGGRYLVIVDDQVEPTDEETTDPNPRPPDEPSSDATA